MDEHGRDSPTWLWKAADAHEVSGEAQQPGLERAQKGDEAAVEGGALPQWRSRGKHSGTAKAMIVGFLVVLVSGARYIMSKRARSFMKTSRLPLNEASQLQLDDESMQKYIIDFNKAADLMETAWDSSGPPVREAFRLHFTPSLGDDQQTPEDPLATISDHVAKMRDCKVPFASSVEARQNFAQHLQLLRSVCRTVALRLEELKWFVHVNERIKVPVPVPGYEEPYIYPDIETLDGRVGSGMRATEFLRYAGLFGGEPMQKVDELLTDKLLPLLSIENKSNAYNSVSRYYFERFLQLSGEGDTSQAAHSTAEYQIPYSGKPFRIGAAARAAERIFRESDAVTNYATVGKMHRIADNWTNEGVLESSKQQEEENAQNFEQRLTSKRELMRGLLHEGIAKDDLVMIAIFLL